MAAKLDDSSAVVQAVREKLASLAFELGGIVMRHDEGWIEAYTAKLTLIVELQSWLTSQDLRHGGFE